MQMQLAIFSLTNVLLADWSTRVRSCHVRTGMHGFESCEADLQIPFYEAFLYYQQLGPLKLRVSWGPYRVWEGRLEDPTQFVETNGGAGLRIVAFGAWVAFTDLENAYTALWSDTRYDQWRMMTAFDAATRWPEKYIFNTQDRVLIGLQKNTSYTFNVDIAQACYQTPDDSTRDILGIQFDYAALLPLNWQVYIQTLDQAFGFIQNTLIFTATGAAQVGSIHLSGLTAGAKIISFLVYNNAGTAVFTGENAADYFQATNIRIVTSTTNRVNTTLGANIAAGTRTVPPAAMTGIYVGQRLFINQGTATGESVVVTAITSTTFTAVFANAHNNADTVHAHVVYPDEIVKDCVSVVSTLNSTQLSSSTSLIQSQTIDIDQAVFEDETPSDVISKMIAKSDNQTTPRQWVALVYNDQILVVRPRGSGLAWYTDITSLEVVRTLTQLYNSVYAIYKDVSNKRNLRTAVSADSTSVAKFGITRRKSIKVETTDATQAEKIRNSMLALQLDPIPRARVTIDRIFDKYGNPFPLYYMRADDTLTLRNLPPTLTATLYDKIRTLVITRTDVDLMAGTIDLELEIPMPNVDVQIAQALKGIA